MVKPFFIGITGPSCSGKTSLINELENKIDHSRLEIIHADDYWNKTFEPPIINGYKNRELPENLKLDLLYSHLTELKKGRSVEIPYKVFEIANGKKIAKPKEIIIVEGFLLFYKKEISNLFDLKIYLDINEEELIKRRIGRNRSGKNRVDYYRSVVISEYTKYGLPSKQKADIMLDGLSSPEKNAQIIINKIKS